MTWLEKRKSRKHLAIYILLILMLMLFTACSQEAPSGLPTLYLEAQDYIKDQLVSPASAQFPDYDTSFVTYDTSILEDLGKGTLEYRVYDVKAFVDSQNAFGVMIRSDYWVKINVYVDDYPSAKFGEEGIHKGIADHYYLELKSLG